MNTKDRIIEAADELFYAGSIRETSVDRIAERAGITKKTLYYHFRSKDDLVAAYLDARDHPTRERYRVWAGTSGPMTDRIVRIFACLSEGARSEDWRGCGFLRAAVELADCQGHPALEVARRHKKAFEAWLTGELERDGYGSARELARLLMTLLDGAVARILISRDPDYAEEAGRAARNLLLSWNSHLPAMYTD